MSGTVIQTVAFAGSAVVKTGITALAGGAAPTLEANTVSGAINTVTTVASDNDSVILAAGLPQLTRVVVANLDAAQDIKIYPPTGGTINGAAANAALVVGQQQTAELIAIGTDGLTFIALLGAVATPA